MRLCRLRRAGNRDSMSDFDRRQEIREAIKRLGMEGFVSKTHDGFMASVVFQVPIPDGSNPVDEIVKQFRDVAEGLNAAGA